MMFVYIYIYIMYIFHMYAVNIYHLLFPLPFCHTTPSYLFPADLKQMGPPLCAAVLLKVSYGFFLAPVAIVLALRGSRLWAL